VANRKIVTDLYEKIRLPIIIAPMFLISSPELVIGAAKAGVIGCLPAANARTIEVLDDWLTNIDGQLQGTDKEGLWGINMIVHNSYDRFENEMSLVERYKPQFVVTALGSPKRVLERVHAYGGKVFSDVINLDQARKAVGAGVDGLILVCAGAGGHTGTYSPFSFVAEVRQFYDGPLIVGGAIQNAHSITALMALGADFAYMGTRFIGCKESLVNDEYREMLIRASMEDIVTSNKVSGVNANWLNESLVKAGFDLANKDANSEINFSNIQDKTKAWKDVWGAGHGVGAINEIESVQQVVDALVSEFKTIKSNFTNKLSNWPNQ
jgi:nitronate monooxygenase